MSRPIKAKFQEERVIPLLQAKNESQRKALKAFTQKQVVVLSGTAGCVDGETEFLTPKGWKKIKDYEDGDMVMQISEYGLEGKFVFPDAYIKEPCDEFLHFKKNGIDQMLSDDHDVAYTVKDKMKLNKKNVLKLINRDGISRGHHYAKVPCIYNYSGQDLGISEFQLRLMVAIKGDGHLAYENTNSYTVRLKKQRKIDRFEWLLSKTGIEYKIHKEERTGYSIYRIHLDCTKSMKEWFGCSVNDARIIFDELKYWDGEINPQGNRLSRFHTCNEEDIDTIQYIANILGLRCTVKVYDRVGQEYLTSGKIYVRKSKEYALNFTRQTHLTMVNQKRGIGYSLVQSVDGFKYCFTVQSGFLLLRRNHQVFVTGNCGKSELACWWASKQWREGSIDTIVITRPYQHLGKDYGAIPGPQPLYADVVTPDGWKKMGDLVPGDYVMSRKGMPTKVLQVFDKGIKDVYRISTSDGRTTYACEDHLWLVQTHNEAKHNMPAKKRTTKEIMDNLLIVSKGKSIGNYILPKCSPVNYSRGIDTVKIHPYVLGVLLGDGTFSTPSASVCLYNNDKELLNKAMEFANGYSFSEFQDRGILFKIKVKTANKVARPVIATNIHTGEEVRFSRIGEVSKDSRFFGIPRGTISSIVRNERIYNDYAFKFGVNNNNWTNQIKNDLEELNLLGKKSYEKFIPESYKTMDVEGRLWLLRGLMDTDGSVDKTGGCIFTTTSHQLAKDVQELVWSLGGMCKLRSRNRIGKQSQSVDGRIIESKRISYEFNFNLPEGINPYFISRKANKYKATKFPKYIRISSVEKVDSSEVRCILVDDEEHLYITNDYIVTHNTDHEKLLPFCMSMLMKFRHYLGPRVLENALRTTPQDFLFKEVSGINIIPIEKIQGLSFNNKTLIICDEAQNSSPEQMKALLTRLEEGCQLIITGDKVQSAIKGKNGLSMLEEILTNVHHPDIATISFTPEDNCRSGVSGWFANIFEQDKQW